MREHRLRSLLAAMALVAAPVGADLADDARREARSARLAGKLTDAPPSQRTARLASRHERQTIAFEAARGVQKGNHRLRVERAAERHRLRVERAAERLADKLLRR